MKKGLFSLVMKNKINEKLKQRCARFLINLIVLLSCCTEKTVNKNIYMETLHGNFKWIKKKKKN